MPIVFHDRSLIKFKHPNKRLKQFTYHEITSFPKTKYKHWHISGKKLLSYSTFLDLYDKKTNLFIEIKSRPHDQNDGHSTKLLNAIVELTSQKKRAYQNIYWMSFDHFLVDLAMEKLKGGFFIKLTEDPEHFFETKTSINQIFGIGLPIRKVSPELIATFHRKNLKVLTYTCNGPRQLQKAISAKVDILISDRPDWLCEYFGRKV